MFPSKCIRLTLHTYIYGYPWKSLSLMTLTALKGIKSTAASAGDDCNGIALPCHAKTRGYKSLHRDAKLFK